MGVTRQDLIRSGRYLKVSDEEWAEELKVRQGVIDCYMANDKWGTRIHKKVGILLTSSPYSRPYLKGSLETHRKLDFWTVLSYDNFINPAFTPEEASYDAWMPPKDVMELVDTFLLTHHQTWGGVSYPFMWQLRLAAGILSSFEYVYCANSDCIIEKPEGFPQLLEMMGDADIMSAGPTLEREIGTAAFIIKGKHFPALAAHMIDHVVPFEKYEESTQEFGNTEGRMKRAVDALGLKVAVCKPPFNEQHHEAGGGFYDAIGFRHVHGEHNYAYRYHKIPPRPEYFDKRYMGDEFNQIKAYWDIVDAKGDMEKANEILLNWWAKD